MTLSEELKWRGFVQQTTYEDLGRLDSEKPTFYMGFDASADSQAIGNLAGMMFAKTLARHGCKAFILAGGSTSLIGDPGGKDKERPMQNTETVAANVKNAETQIRKIFHDQPFTLVNNLDWTKGLSVLTFLREIGKHFSMTPLIQRDYIAQRIGEGGDGISYTEFSYGLLQAMDFLYLHDQHKVNLQLGGSDQWGNCLGGVELVRKARGAEVNVITLPLVINKSTGKKFGKTEEGAVWLNPNKTSPFKFYQFWINVDDESVEDYLKIYTELGKDDIETLMREHNEQRSIRSAQKRLAFEVTKLVHGEDSAGAVKRVSACLFDGHDYSGLTKTDFELLAGELPVIETDPGASLVDALVGGKLASSKTEARNLLSSNAVYINGLQFSSEKTALDRSDSLHGFVVLRKGKNSTCIIKLK